MKKTLLFSALIAGMMFFQDVSAWAGPGPQGHRAYSKHQKQHKLKKAAKPHGRLDATYS